MAVLKDSVSFDAEAISDPYRRPLVRAQVNFAALRLRSELAGTSKFIRTPKLQNGEHE